jgi:hypothetical protein
MLVLSVPLEDAVDVTVDVYGVDLFLDGAEDAKVSMLCQIYQHDCFGLQNLLAF